MWSCSFFCPSSQVAFKLLAYRGGVVDSSQEEEVVKKEESDIDSDVIVVSDNVGGMCVISGWMGM